MSMSVSIADVQEKEEDTNARTDPRTSLIQSYTLKAFKVAHFSAKPFSAI